MGQRTGPLFVAALLAWVWSGGVAAFTSEPYVVRDDHGGSVHERLKDISALRASGRATEIRGLVCHSSCTMLLGLEEVCVQPHTRFGFHGPSRRGVPLKMEEFEAVSRLIASQYPPDLREWYMNVARHSLDRLYILSGAELIAMNVARACDPLETASAKRTLRGEKG